MSPSRRRLPALGPLVGVGLGILAFSCEPEAGKDADPIVDCEPVARVEWDTTGAQGEIVTLDATTSTVCDPASIVYTWTVLAAPEDSAVSTTVVAG